MSIGRFYAGVGALIWHPGTARYLFLRRAGSKDFGAGAWECVTGRVDQGEGFEEALYREVREELGVAVVADFLVGTTHFYRGAPRPEDELLGLVYCCTLDNPAAILLSAEHEEARWLSAAEARALLGGEAQSGWLLRALVRAERLRQQLPPALLACFRAEGFDVNGDRLPAG